VLCLGFSAIGEIMSAGRFEVRLGDLKNEWVAFCDAKGVNPSKAIKMALIHLMRAGSTGKTSDGVVTVYGVEAVSEPKKRVEVQLTASEREAADNRAKQEGFPSTNLWIAATVRAALTNMPQFGKHEIEALGKSNHELLAIGRNLNQIAKYLNSVNGNATDYDGQFIRDMAVTVKRHVSKVGDVLRASIYRWKLK
jgi:hypothetical protein